MEFEWDENKSKSNLEKHGIDFDHAKEAFSDKDAVYYPGRNKDGEERHLLVGKTFSKVLIAVIYTLRKTAYRIISAR